MDAVKVSGKGITGNLKVPRCSLVHLLDKLLSIASRAPSQVPRQDKFRRALDCDEAVGVTFQRVARDVPLFLAPGEAPHLVILNVGHRQAFRFRLQERLALLTDKNEQGNYCCVPNAGESLYSADEVSFNKKLNCLSRLIQAGVRRAKRRSVIFCEGLGALVAAVALKAVALFSDFRATGIAVGARHFVLSV